MPTKDSSFRVSFMGTCNSKVVYQKWVFTNIANDYSLKIKKLLSGIHGLRIKEIYIEDFLTKNIPS